MKSIILARVSTPDQEETGYSLPAQEKLLQDYTGKKHFDLRKIYSISESASGKQQREIFNQMMAYVKKNDIKVIVCEKVDRLTRNFKDAVDMDRWLEEDEERQLHFVKDSLIMHKNSFSQEKLNWGVRILFAKNYIDNLSEEVKKGQKEKIAQGWLPSKAPLGYLTVGEKGHKTHDVDPLKGPLVKKMFEYYSTGIYTIKSLVEKMRSEGLINGAGEKITKTRVHKYLSDPFYMGVIIWNGKEYPGKHIPLVSKGLFEAVQKKLGRTDNNLQYKKHLPVFKAAIRCGECRGTITWETQKGHWYGHCNHFKACSQKSYIREEKVEEQLFPYFDKVAPKNDRVVKWLDSVLKEGHADEVAYVAAQRDSLNRTFERAQKRLEAIYVDKIDDRIPAEFYERMFAQYTNEKEDALNSLKDLNTENTKYYEAGYAIHELATHAKEIYLNPKTTTEDKRMLLSFVFSNRILNADSVAPNYTLAFQFLSDWMPKLNKNFELQENALDKTKTEVLASVDSVLLPLWGVLRTINWRQVGDQLQSLRPSLVI